VTAFIFVSQKAGPRGPVEDLFADMSWVQDATTWRRGDAASEGARRVDAALEHLVWEIRALDSVGAPHRGGAGDRVREPPGGRHGRRT
jgi:hypothetical protein